MVMQAFEELEIEWGKFIGNPNCVACSSGTSALHLALETLRRPAWNSHARCIVPEYTMIACARAVVLADMQPMFVDCDDKLLMNLDDLPTWNVRALQAVHIYGRPCDMYAISNWATKNDAVVIEDMSEIHGVNPHPNTDAACWSFYKNKIIHGEEGGMIAFKKPEEADRAKRLRSLGSTEKNDYLHIPRGHNYRLSNVHAELILDSLEQYPVNRMARQTVVRHYDDLIPSLFHMPRREANWVYDIRVPGLTSAKQDQIVSSLNFQGIAVRHGFKCMSVQPEFVTEDIGRTRFTSNAYKASQEVIYFPVYPNMTREDVLRNVNAFLTALQA